MADFENSGECCLSAFTNSLAASSYHLSALKNTATNFKAAASSRPVPNTNNLPQQASVQLTPIHVSQPPTQQLSTHSTPVNPTPGPPDNANIPAPMTIPYNESEIIPPNSPIFNNHCPSTHQYPTRARNRLRHLIDCVLKEHTVNMCMVPEMVESAIRPLWSIKYSATHRPTTDCMYNVMNEETGEMQNNHKLLKQDSTREIWALSMCKDLGKLSQGYKGLVEGTYTFFLMSHDKIRDIPPDKTVTYARIVVNY